MAVADDLTGRRFGRLEVIERSSSDARGVLWKLHCACGVEIERHGADLRRSRRPARSCGCLKKDNAAGLRHGHASSVRGHSPTYASWISARARCEDPKNASFARYGAAGISMCDAWRASFETFLRDMGERPPGTSLERRNNELGYAPGNCRWATRLEQSQNRSGVTMLEHGGELMSLKAYARVVGVGYTSLLGAMRRGMDHLEATEHLRQHGRRHRHPNIARGGT